MRSATRIFAALAAASLVARAGAAGNVGPAWPQPEAVATDPCGGVKVYVYRDLPASHPDYDGRELLSIPPAQGRQLQPTMEFGVPCIYDKVENCTKIMYWGRGDPVDSREVPQEVARKGIALHQTLQNALPWMFAGHLVAHCEAATPEEAHLFFVPYPVISLKRAVHRGGITKGDVERHYNRVKRFLETRPAWDRCGGCDHILSVEAPFPDFGRYKVHNRGGYFHEDPFWQRVVRLSHHTADFTVTLEGHHGLRNTGGSVALPVVSMPWPMAFHPTTDAQVDGWVSYVFPRGQTRDPRAVLIANHRPHRHKLFHVCEAPDTPCVRKKATDLSQYFPIYRDFVFAISPGGDVPTRRAFFDTLLAGCIPVVFAPEAAVAGRTDFRPTKPEEHYRHAFARFFGEETGWGEGWLDEVALVADDEWHAMQLVRETPASRVAEMQANIRRIVPRMLFWDHTAPPETAEAPSAYRSQGVVPTTLRLIASDVKAQLAA